MPSVVSIPPNIMTAAFEMTSASVSGPAASDSTITLTGTAMARAASRLRRTWYPRGACTGTRC